MTSALPETTRIAAWAAVLEQAVRSASQGSPPEVWPDGPAEWPVAHAMRKAFDLTSFELRVLCMAAAWEVAPAVRRAIADHPASVAGRPTFALAHAVLPSPEWRACQAGGPLLRHDLISRIGDSGVLTTPIATSEPIVTALVTGRYDDPWVDALTIPLLPRGPLPESHREVVQRLERALEDGRSLWLTGDASVAACAQIVASTAARRGERVRATRASNLLDASAARRWSRFARLRNEWLVVEHREGDPEAKGSPPDGRVIRLGASPRGEALAGSTVLHVPAASCSDRRALWREALGPDSRDDLAAELAHRTRVDSALVAEVAASARVLAAAHPETLRQRILDRLLAEAGPTLRTFATPLPPARREDVVLTATVHDALGHILEEYRAQPALSHRDGDSEGYAALFSGPSGTGKSLSARLLAHELEVPLFRVDLGRLVSKWIGETEANISALFDAAAQCGAALLFDEADALFAQRTAVHGSNDRYANLQVDHLLQRLESLPTLVILTTNVKDGIDSAFSRRFRQVVSFPQLDREGRHALFERCLAAAGIGRFDVPELAEAAISAAEIVRSVERAQARAHARGRPMTQEDVATAVKDLVRRRRAES